MNREELKDAVAEIGIADNMVAIKGYAEYAWCVVEAEDGTWEVFWGERGNKIELESFSSEHQACNYLLGRLTYSQILADLF